MSCVTFVLDRKVASLTLLQCLYHCSKCTGLYNCDLFIHIIFCYVTYTIVVLICVHIVFSLLLGCNCDYDKNTIINPICVFSSV